MARIQPFTTYVFLSAVVLTFLNSCSKKDEPETAKVDSAATTAPVDGTTSIAPPTEGGLTPQERHFVSTALTGSKNTAGIAQLALKSTGKVKALASSLLKAHAAAYDELLRIAIDKHLTLDTIVSAMQAQSKALLAQLSGKEFDQEFIAVMVRDHQKAHDDFALIASSGTDSTLKAYAQKHLETIDEHLKQAQSITPAK